VTPLNRRSDHLVLLIATCNRLPSLRRTVESVLSQTKTPHEIFVIDGGSTDGTVDYLKSDLRITPVLQGRLLGTARAYNEVWRDIDCKYTCWLSDDTEIVNNILDVAIGILENDQGIGMVGLKMKDMVGPWKNLPYMGSISRYGIINCNHGVLPMSLLKKVGYFNEDYRSYMVDPDLTASVLCTGKRVVITKSVGLLHHREWAERRGYQHKEVREKAGVDNLGIYKEKFSFLEIPKQTARAKGRIHSNGLSWLGRTGQRLLFRASFHLMRLGALRSRELVNLLCGKFIRGKEEKACVRQPYHLVQLLPDNLVKHPLNPYTTAP
jgi:GT2 family glycosyltransferase